MPIDCVDVTTESDQQTGPSCSAHEVLAISQDGIDCLGLTMLGAATLQQIARDPEALLVAPLGQLKMDLGRRVVLIESLSPGYPGLWCCKANCSRHPWIKLVTRLGSFRFHNAFRQGLALLQAGLATPLPLAVLTGTRDGIYREYLLTEAITESQSLQAWLAGSISTRPNVSLCESGDKGEANIARSPSPPAPLPRVQGRGEPVFRKAFRRRQDGLARRAIIVALADQLQRLHEQRFDHRDLKPTNVLISQQDDKLQVWLIDLDGVRRWPVWLPWTRRIQNLARLWAGVALSNVVTRTDALRFLLRYLPHEDRQQWKSLWRRIARRAARKLSDRARVNSTNQVAGVGSQLRNPSIGNYQKSAEFGAQ